MPNPLLQMATQASVPEKQRSAPDPQSMTQPEQAFQDVLDDMAEFASEGPDVTVPDDPEINVETIPEVEEGEVEPSEVAVTDIPQPPWPEAAHQIPTEATAAPVAAAPAELQPVQKNAKPVPEQGTALRPNGTAETQASQDPPIAPPSEKSASARPDIAFAQSGTQSAIQAKFAQIAKPERGLTEAAGPLSRFQTTGQVRITAPEKNPVPTAVSGSAPLTTNKVDTGGTPLESAVSSDTDIPDLAPIKEQQSTPLRDTTIGQMPQAARAEIARAIAGQMAAVITAKPGTVEVALNPEELGRVSITFNGRDDGAYMTIIAERPETLDLMRRHISVLAEEFQKLGFDDLSFDLGTPGDSDPENHDTASSHSDGMTLAQEDSGPAPQPRPIRPDGGLDMRL